jgi:hypothetical protein
MVLDHRLVHIFTHIHAQARTSSRATKYTHTHTHTGVCTCKRNGRYTKTCVRHIRAQTCAYTRSPMRASLLPPLCLTNTQTYAETHTHVAQLQTRRLVRTITSICIYICTHARRNCGLVTCERMYMRRCMCIFTCLCMTCTSIHEYECLYECAHVNCVCAYVYVYIYIYVLCICIRTCMSACTYTYTYI